MLVCILKNLQQNKIYKAIRWFFSSPFYIILIALTALMSEIYGRLDIAIYVFCSFGVIIPVLFLDDLRALIAPLFFGYVTVSKLNNDSSLHISLFSIPKLKELILVFGIIIGVLFVLRIIFDLIFKVRKVAFPKYLIGLILVLIAFVLGGVFTKYYESKTVLFGLSLGLFLIVPYIVLIITVDFETLKPDYFAYLLTIFGLTVSIELFMIYKEIGFDSVLTDPNFRNKLYTGWGINNNIGGEICIGLTASAYLAIKKKLGFIYLPIMFVDLFAILISTSRGSILFGIILFIVTITIVSILSKGIRRVINILTILVLSILAIYLFFKYQEKVEPFIVYILNSFARDDLDSISSNRLTIYKKGYEQFKSSVFSGVGFFELEDSCGYLQTGFMPFRYHNTFVQLAASTGIIGLLTYLFHRGQTYYHLFKKPDLEKLFITLAILGLISTSLLDCHFFNLGPTMEYSILLALFEGMNLYNKKDDLETLF